MLVDVISVPYRYDQRAEGVGAGPDALLAAGLVNRLRDAGLEPQSGATATLAETDRESGRTAVNIGKLGADTARLVAEARHAEHGALVLAGDDTAAIGVVAGLQAAAGASAPIGIVWLDAHGDFNTPETSYSGILAGMPLAILAGLAGPLWREAAGLAAPIATDRLVVAGTRDLDEKEAELLRSTDVRVIPIAELRDGRSFSDVVSWLARRSALLYLHVDLDVLDPRFIPSASTPAANGLTIDELTTAMKTVLATGKVAATTLTSLNPGAGQRGQRSLESALAVLTRSLADWHATPPANVSG
ncbi:MAG: arginase family protein [Thermomicrobiales bacterium]